MLTKEKVMHTMQELPEEFSIDDLMERLILIEKIERGLQQTKEGKIISHEVLKREVQKWRR